MAEEFVQPCDQLAVLPVRIRRDRKITISPAAEPGHSQTLKPGKQPYCLPVEVPVDRYCYAAVQVDQLLRQRLGQITHPNKRSAFALQIML